MLEQSAEQKAEIGARIDWVMKELVPDTVQVYMRKHGALLERKLGLTPDDVLNDVRVQVWKALLTFQEGRGARLRTYVNKLIENRFRLLFRRSGLRKYTSLEYFAHFSTDASIDQEQFVTEETGETIFERRLEFAKDLAYLSRTDREILRGLVQGDSIAELVVKTKQSRPEVVGAIGRIDLLVRKRRERD